MIDLVDERLGLLDEEENDRNKDDYDKNELNNYEEALSRIGFGRFHCLLLLLCGFANASDAIEILCVSFILPSAECDLNLTSEHKGFLNAITFLGMMIGGYVWGALSDIRGRKYILITSLLFNATFAFLSGISQSYIHLLVFRFLSGVGVGGSIPIVWSYFAEFMPKIVRGRLMCCLASFWLIGNLLVVFLAYVILHLIAPFEFLIVWNTLKINNWRVFMMSCAVPSFLSAISFLFVPESPKFYLYNNKNVECQKVLEKIYLFNNRIVVAEDIDRKVKTFKFFEKLKHRPIISPLDEHESQQMLLSSGYLSSLKHNIINILKKTSSLFCAPYTRNTIIILFILFSLMFGYYGLWMWLPELYKRMSVYGGTPCHLKINGSIIPKNEQNKTCTIDRSVFVSSFIGAMSNAPANLITIIYIDRLGRNLITVSSLIISGFSVLGIAFIQTQTQGTILTTIFGGISTLAFNSFGCTCTEVYPTKLRSTALGTQYVAGRLGAILGNLVFGLAIDTSCYIPLVSIFSIMVLSGLLALKLPESNKMDIH